MNNNLMEMRNSPRFGKAPLSEDEEIHENAYDGDDSVSSASFPPSLSDDLSPRNHEQVEVNGDEEQKHVEELPPQQNHFLFVLQELARRDQFEPISPMSVNLDSSDDEQRDY